MNLLKTLSASAALAAAAASANAFTITRAGGWVVEADRYDDGEEFCRALTHSDGLSMSLYFKEYGPLTLQLFFPDAAFDLTDDMEFAVQIDNRDPWHMTGAQTLGSSIFFEFPDNGDTSRFLSEVWKGRTLFFLGAGGQRLWSVSLRGSAASMAALAQCRDLIQ